MLNFKEAATEYKNQGVDVEKALKKVAEIPISIHCWQGDDLAGFEVEGASLNGGGIQTTGNFPGKARNINELRADLEKVLSLDGGKHRINLHASYGDFKGEFKDRNNLDKKYFYTWIDWAKKMNLGIDFNGTFFSHPKANNGFTLSSPNPKIRNFWIEHEKQCREIAAFIGKEMESPCILDTWIPDGTKNLTSGKIYYRQILKESLDECFKVEYSPEYMRDALETKLFGIGSESYVVGSHEFYMNYAARNNKMLCIDMGHFNVGEDVSDKLSSILLFDDELLMHVSRPMHWDSDHVILFNEKIKNVAEELVRSDKLDKVHIGLDFFDASINRIGAWAIGTRTFRKALLFALLEPNKTLLNLELENRGFEHMALLERQNTLPFGTIWEEYCKRTNTYNDDNMVKVVLDYERDVLLKRG